VTTRWTDSDAPKGDEYDRRFSAMAESGVNPHGEAQFIESLGPGSVLDAGCGTGRVARELAKSGIRVVGADVDPSMLDTARRQAPMLSWYLTDLCDLDLQDSKGNQQEFDVVVTAGNVMLFVRAGSERETVQRCANHLRYGGALVSGFQLRSDGYSLEEYDADCAAAGLELVERFSSWHRDPFVDDDYAVSVHRRA
jgi:2-polyprenyl-3-methyl-5-hydroxy-6-metoxy-1,4-benzoquinol methylase